VKKEAGIMGTLLFLLSSYPSLGDPTPEPTATPEVIPTPHKNSSGLDRAIQIYTELIRDTPSSASAYAMRGAARFSEGDYEEALADAEQALTLDPHCVSALSTRASIRQRKGDVTGAIDDLTSLTAETPKSFQPWATRGILRINKGDIDGALHDFDTVIALAPNFKEALEYRATIYFRKFAYRDAIQDLNRAIDLDPSYSIAFGSRGDCELQINDLDAARNDYTRAIELDPASGMAIHGLGLVALHAQDPKRALDYFNRAIQLNSYPLAYISRSVAEIALGAYHEAILDLSQAERATPKNQDGPETLLWVARALKGDTDGANAELRAYLDDRKSTDDWGLKRARFLLGEIDEDLFLHKTSRGPAQLCEAYFYAGLKRLLAGDKSGAMDFFDTCTRFEIHGFVEDELAHIKLKELAENPGE
jgi:tetratricopeptide (TPR) repeat protein